MSRQFGHLPACPIPIQWDKVNQSAAIDLYMKGVLPGLRKLIQDGNVAELRDIGFHRAW
ncbi:hypothetical protein EMPG_12434 [Blastomyces silverae]|uniref:Uncharacterized protein n=1 Tax=Blastomyces silverae TaxID=2060906 RepID=A0A0H1BNG2_9EURO|nr:hypothetical protein EMPG_12434 [Blastomyces silverae]